MFPWAPAQKFDLLLCCGRVQLRSQAYRSQTCRRQKVLLPAFNATCAAPQPHKRHHCAPALLLPTDLWAKVFSVVAEDAFGEVLSASTAECCGGEDESAESYTRFHKLRLVWKHFRQVFEEQPALSTGLFLDQRFHCQALTSLLHRTRRWNTSLNTIVAKCGSPS